MSKPVLRRGRTIWLGKANDATRYPVFRGHDDAEIAIAGGGMTEAMIAEAFTRIGTRVTVLEAERVGHGSTAASTALLLQEPDHDLAALTRSYDARRARRIWQLSHDAARDIGPHRRYPRHLFALGYGGNGMTFAALAARILVEQWSGTAAPDHALLAFNR